MTILIGKEKIKSKDGQKEYSKLYFAEPVKNGAGMKPTVVRNRFGDYSPVLNCSVEAYDDATIGCEYEEAQVLYNRWGDIIGFR